MSEDKPHESDDWLAETKRIMERLVRTPPKPHKPKSDGEKSEKPPVKRRGQGSDITKERECALGPVSLS